MADGYGFGAEGDWKAAGLVRLMKVIAAGRKGGVSFMEDYTYHLVKGQETILGAHMLEICPSIADGGQALAGDSPARHRRQGRSLPAGLQRGAGTGGRPPRSSTWAGGCGWSCSEMDAVKAEHADAEAAGGAGGLRAAAGFPASAAGLAAGGRRAPHLVQPGGHRRTACRTWPAMLGIECVRIGNDTDLAALKNELRWNDAAYRLRS